MAQELHEVWNDRLEIEGDAWEEYAEAYYQDWQERNAAMVPAGIGTDAAGEPVPVWQLC